MPLCSLPFALCSLPPARREFFRVMSVAMAASVLVGKGFWVVVSAFMCFPLSAGRWETNAGACRRKGPL